MGEHIVCLYSYNCSGCNTVVCNEKMDFPLFLSCQCVCYSKNNILLIFYQVIFSIFPLCLLTCITWFHLSLHSVPYLWLRTNRANSCETKLWFQSYFFGHSLWHRHILPPLFYLFFLSFFSHMSRAIPDFSGSHSSVSCCGTIGLAVTYNTAEGRRASFWLLGYRGTRSIFEEFLHYELSHCHNSFIFTFSFYYI